MNRYIYTWDLGIGKWLSYHHSFNWIEWHNQYSKHETFEDRYINMWLKFDILELERDWKYKEVEKLKQTKWLWYKDQEKLFNTLKRKFQFKHKIEKSDVADYSEILDEYNYLKKWKSNKLIVEILDKLKYIKNYEIQLELEKDWVALHPSIKTNEPEFFVQKEKLKKEYDILLKEELNKKLIKNRLKELKEKIDLVIDYNYENYRFVKDLNWNMIDVQKKYEELKNFKTNFPYMFYTADDVVEKIKESNKKQKLNNLSMNPRRNR